jgi:hypothetical protein
MGVLAVLVIAVLALLSQGILHSLNYFETVDQALAHRAKIGTEVIRSRRCRQAQARLSAPRGRLVRG